MSSYYCPWALLWVTHGTHRWWFFTGISCSPTIYYSHITFSTCWKASENRNNRLLWDLTNSSSQMAALCTELGTSMQKTINGANGAVRLKCWCHKLSAGAFNFIVLPVACFHLLSPPTAAVGPRWPLLASWPQDVLQLKAGRSPGLLMALLMHGHRLSSLEKLTCVEQANCNHFQSLPFWNDTPRGQLLHNPVKIALQGSAKFLSPRENTAVRSCFCA